MNTTPRIRAARIVSVLLVLGIILETVYNAYMFHGLGASMVIMYTDGPVSVFKGCIYVVCLILWTTVGGLSAGTSYTLFTGKSEQSLSQAARMNSKSFKLAILVRIITYPYAIILINAFFFVKSYTIYILCGFIGFVITVVCHIILLCLLKPYKVKGLSKKGFRRFPAIGAAVGAAVAAALLIHMATIIVPVMIAQKNITAFKSFEAQTFEGETVTQDILKDKITVINIWETTCGPCKSEMPDMENVSHTLDGTNVQLIGMCFDTQKSEYLKEPHSVDEAKAILEELGVTYLNLQPSEELCSQITGFVVGFPTSVVVDENGNVLEFFSGYKDEAEWTQIVQKYVK